VCATSIEIRLTENRRGAIALGVAAGLDERGPGDVGAAAMWGAYDDDALVGTVTLGTLHGLNVVSWLAVDEAYRGRGLGRLLLGELEAEVLRRGIREVWAPVREPEFFRAWGYEEIFPGEERKSPLADCLECRRFGRTCQPQVVVKRWS
jgi:N-acetylglutamate synthase-like GNAT family acetyltransferase